MPGFLRGFGGQFEALFGSSSAGKLLSFLVLTGLIVLSFVGLLVWSRQPDYQLLYRNLPPEDSAAVIEALDARNTPYRLTADGTCILVPAKDLPNVRIELAGKGVLQGEGVGFEIFDKRSFGMTSFQEKLNYQRALQGELARTIAQLREVDGARVHLVLPEKSLFQEDQAQPSASVVIRLKQGHHLEQSQVHGIVRLIAGSVEGLQSDNVTVVDSSGRLLAGPTESPFPGSLTSGQMEYQDNLERGLEKRIQTMLEPVAGKGKVVARVSAVMDFTQVESTVESYDPDATVVRSEQRSDERSTAESNIPSGVAGTSAVTQPAGASRSAGGEGASFRRQEETINYEVSKVTKRVIEPTGRLQRLSVAVVVDGTYEEARKDDGSVERTYAPRTPEEMAAFERTIKNAIGYDASRGDMVEVANVPFDNSGLDVPLEATDGFKSWDLVMVGARYGGVALLLLFVFFGVLRPLIRWLTAGGGSLEIAGTLPKTVGELEREMGGALPGQPARPSIPGSSAVDESGELARRDPSQVAHVIRGWLSER